MKKKFHETDGKAQHALMNGLIFFFLKGWRERDFLHFSFWVGAKWFIIFSLIPNGFPPCSNQIPKMFPNAFVKMFLITLSFYPIWFAQSSTPMYINQKVKSKGAQLFIFCKWGSKEVLLYGACPMFQKNLLMGQSIWLL